MIWNVGQFLTDRQTDRQTDIQTDRQTRLCALDAIKAISIIAVIFYHLGVLKNGYLGVESFFVVSGYSFARGVKYSKLKDDVINPIISMLRKHYFLILCACLFILVFGFFFVFPIYYKSFGYESIAALLLSSNILQVIKATDYWNVSNITNPLMHMWYICVMIKSLALLRIMLWGSNKLVKKVQPIFVYILIFLISFCLYLLPVFSATYKFYLVPFRLYEVAFGCIVCEFEKRKPLSQANKTVSTFEICAIIVVLFIGNVIEINRSLLMISVLVLTVAFIYSNKSVYQTSTYSLMNLLCIPGRYSFQIYIWHQVIIALSMMLVFDSVNFVCIVWVLLLTALFTYASIRISCSRLIVSFKRSLPAIVAVILCVMVFAGVTYAKKGVYFSYPELGLSDSKEDPDRWISYVDRVYSWETEFEDDDRLKVLVIGNSYGRDFANIIYESNIEDCVDLTYVPQNLHRPFEQIKHKIDRADLVFYSVDYWEEEPKELYDYCWDKLIIVGNKCFSKNTKVWLKRFGNDYLTSVVPVPTEFLQTNEKMKEKYVNHYIDMMSYVLDENNMERVFTDDGCYISVDGKHLSKEGAIFYAREMDMLALLTELFSK